MGIVKKGLNGIKGMLSFMVTKHEAVRCDLQKLHNYRRYNEACDYAKKNMNVKGVKEVHQNLLKANEQYKQEYDAIVEVEKENEVNKYQIWDKWFKVNDIISRIGIGDICLYVVNIVIKVIGFNASLLTNGISTLVFCASILLVPLFLITKIGESISRKGYNQVINRTKGKINIVNEKFEKVSGDYYKQTDNLYLSSLDPAHREMVYMRREQQKHNDEMLRIENEKRQQEMEQLREMKKTRYAQERILEIEEERVRRYNS